MVSPSSNRNNPVHVQYFENLADSIGIFWQFHSERVKKGNIDFAMVPSNETTDRDARLPVRSAVRYDPRQRKDGRPQTPLYDFANAVTRTMDGSWQQFLEGNNMLFVKQSLLSDVEVPEYSKRFFDPFVADKLKQAETLGGQLPSPGFFDLGRTLAQGTGTGVTATTQLHGLFGKELRPIMSIALSKVRVDSVHPVLEEIGALPISGTADSHAYTLLDDSTMGLDRSRLRELGAGDTLGCPASMNVSPETGIFLADRGVNVEGTTMLADFAAEMPTHIDAYVGEWFRGLTHVERQTYIDPEQLRVMTGEARRTAVESKIVGGCPYGKERL